MADRDQHSSREDEIRHAVFDQVDLQTAELEIVGSIYDGFAAAIMVKGQPRTVALTREYGDAVQLMALIERGRTALFALPGDGASLADHVYCPPGLSCPPIAEAASKPQGCGAIYAAAYDSIREGAPGLSDATCAVIARSINMKAALSAQPQPRDEAQPVRGEIRVIDGNRCRFIERELEGDKWEVIGPVVVKETAAPVREEGGAVEAAWRESFIADEEEGPVSGVVIDLPDGSQIWTGDCSNTLLDSMGGERPDESGQFLTVAIKGKPTRVVASVASTEDGIALARALASALAPSEAGKVDEDWIRGLIGEAVVMAEDQEREDESDEEICRIAGSVLNAIRPYLHAQPQARSGEGQ